MGGYILGQPQGRLSGTANRDHRLRTRGTRAAGGELRPRPVFRPAQGFCFLMYPGAPLWSPARLGGVWGTLRVSDKLFCMGISKKRLTATQANVGSAHFFRTWSESALRPPSCAEGPRKDPSPPAPPPWPSVGRCLAWVSERLPGTAARARSPARPRPPPPGPWVSRWCPARGRARASRMVPRGRPRGARFPRCDRLGSGHGTRKRGDGTREPAQAARFRAPQASAGRPAAPTASRGPLQRAGGA